TTNFGNANLFLINPAGWLFGPTASLDVGGSFHLSTADYLKFTDNATFHADLNKRSVLSPAPVSAFGFLSEYPAGILIQGSTLQIPEQKTLSLVSGDIEISGRSSSGIIRALGGTINVASVGAPGEVPTNLQILDMGSFDRLGQTRLSNT